MLMEPCICITTLRPLATCNVWYAMRACLAAATHSIPQPLHELLWHAVPGEVRPHLYGDSLRPAAGVNCGVVVHVVPGACREVGLRGDGTLVHNGRNEQRIACIGQE